MDLILQACVVVVGRPGDLLLVLDHFVAESDSLGFGDQV